MNSVYLDNNILYHRDTMEKIYLAYCKMNRSDFVYFATSEGIKKEHAVIMWQVFDIVEEKNKEKK